MATHEYLEMYHLDTPELIAKHIECLKRNTKPDLVLISSLAEKLIQKDIENKNQLPEFVKGLSYVEMVSEAIKKEIKKLEGEDDLLMGQINDDVIFNHNQGEKDTMEYLKEAVRGEEVYKESEGKLFYELDWGFVTQMAERMSANKQNSKYKMWNWQQKMSDKTFEDLKQASMRHLLEIMQGRYEDDGREFGHLEALSTNLMMINYQLKQK